MMSQEQNLLRVSTHLSPSEAEIEDAGVRSSKRARGHPTWKQRDEEDSSEKQTSGKRSASDLAASRAKVQKTATTSVSAPAMPPPMSPSSPVRSPAPSPRFPSLVVTPHSSSSVQSAGNLSSTPRPLARSLLDSPVASTSQSSRDLDSDSVRRLEMLLRAVEVNRQQLVQLTNLVNSLVAGNIRPVEQLPDNITLPLTTVEQVDELEERLSRDSAFVNVLENHLGLIGGTDVKETTRRRILSAGLAPEVQRKRADFHIHVASSWAATQGRNMSTLRSTKQEDMMHQDNEFIYDTLEMIVGSPKENVKMSHISLTHIIA
ncbi:uncharacterized protein KZ484_013249 [Pholidichthys leucotaenia]